MSNEKITVALSKGRILKQTLPLFESLGIAPIENPNESRSLIIPSTSKDVQFIIVRATDAPTYVRLGTADIGIVGKDVLMEADGAGIAELIDLNIAKCRISVAGHNDIYNGDVNSISLQELAKRCLGTDKRKLQVATKYVNIAKRYFAEQGQQCEVIKLYGSMELAPLTGLADLIVDLVDTGSTLKANSLNEYSIISNISSRLVANKVAYKTKRHKLMPIIESLSEAVS